MSAVHEDPAAGSSAASDHSDSQPTESATVARSDRLARRRELMRQVRGIEVDEGEVLAPPLPAARPESPAPPVSVVPPVSPALPVRPGPPASPARPGSPAPSVRPAQVGGGGLDPQRPIAPPPGVMPWEMEPFGERGVSQGMPVAYVPRPVTAPFPSDMTDAVQRRLGAPPPPSPVTVRLDREQLPSLKRRDRARRVRTLVGYSAVIAVSGAGLIGLAAIAFGW